MDQVLKANDKFPEIVATLARDKYPCTDLLKPDTVTMYEDSLVFIECPDSNYSAGDYAIVRTDTIYKTGESRTVRVPVKILVPSKVVTRWYEDSAKLKLMSLEISRLKTELSKSNAERDKYKGKSDHRGKENWIWRAIATVLICWQVFKIYKRLTTIKVT